MAERAVETRPERAPAPGPDVRNEVHAGPNARQPAKLAAMPASAAAKPTRPRNSNKAAPMSPSTPPP